VLWALPRALILLPTDFPARFDNPATRELVLRHELVHVCRGDALWSLAMEIASALLWFHPLAWVARSRFRLDQELACDATALRALPERNASYARALVASVAAQPAPALIPWLAEPQLKERIAMISRIPPGALRRRAGFAAIALLLAGGLYVAGARAPVQAATQTNSSPKLEYQNSPKYPVRAIRKGEQGMVMLNLVVDEAGRVTKVSIDLAKTTAPVELQTAAAQAASNWLFKPGVEDGLPVASGVEVPVTFLLKPQSLSARAIRATTLGGKTYYSCVDCRLVDAPRKQRN
jgi:TonB family protein